MTTTPVATKPLTLPEPVLPMLMLMISNPIVPGSNQVEPITWAVSKAHPFVPNAVVVRMFIDRGCVEIYSLSADKKSGMRDLVPLHWVRLIQEAMTLELFVEEMEDAELAKEEEDDDEEEETAGPEISDSVVPEPAPNPANGQITS